MPTPAANSTTPDFAAVLALPHVAALHAYAPGLQPTEPGWVKLNTNECPYPPSPLVAAAITAELGGAERTGGGRGGVGASLRLYPEPTSAALRAAIAAHHGGEASGLSAANVCVGNGSDDILNLLVRCFCGAGGTGVTREAGAAGARVAASANAASGRAREAQGASVDAADASTSTHERANLSASELPSASTHAPHRAGFSLPSYSLYPVLVGIADGESVTIEFDRTLTLPVEKIAASGASIFFLTSPNAPTGVGFSEREIEAVLAAYDGLLVVDEAYAPFAREDALRLLARYPRLVVVRTFSKAYALAGIRVGYCLAHPQVIALLDRVRDSYNVNRLSQAAALAALSDTSYYAGVIRQIRATRDAYLARFAAAGWFCYPSQANFIFAEPRTREGETGAAVAQAAYDFLCARRVLVRHFPKHALTAPFLRISVGTDEQMLTLWNTLQAWLHDA